MIDFRTYPDQYRHWRLSIDGGIATLALDVDENGGIAGDYALKLNSYDLGVDIELADAVQRLRFEHPQVRAVVLTSAKDRVFSAGANIPMLSRSSHIDKVNFCKFTNETRNAIEDASANAGQRWMTVIAGTAAGGGYELALATDHIVLVDDGSTAVSLPEVPLLAVLPGTGGLTRVVDKRCVRRDRADYFCTTGEGVRGRRALDWKLVDELVPRSRLDDAVAARAAALAEASDRPADARGIVLPPLKRTLSEDAVAYRHVQVALDRAGGTATLTVSAPEAPPPAEPAAIHAAGADFWPLALARELDDAILHLRFNEPAIGTWVFKTTGAAAHVAAADAALAANAGRLAGARDHPLPQAHPETPRRERAQPGRADRAGLLLHRHVAGARARGGSELHARRHLRGLERGAGDGAAHGNERRPAADGQRALTPCQPLPRR